MSWSYRKSISAGPVRINFARRGISYSVGVKGARVNVGPRGTYVNLSAHGISYRSKIAAPPSLSPRPAITSPSAIQHIGSAAMEQLTDTDSKAFITELTEKSAQGSYVRTARYIAFLLSFIQVCCYWGNFTNPYFFLETITGIALFTPIFSWLKKADRQRFEMELHYDMDDGYQQVYQQFSTHFSTFTRSTKVWQYLNAQATSDLKRNAGAGRLIQRTPVRGIAENKAPLPYFITNVSIPYIALQHIELFFLPERLLIKRGNTFAAVFYKHLNISGSLVRFIESDALPVDATVVDHTWQYVNKNGGPDKRFNNNRRLPICHYSQYQLTSGTGIFEILSTSKAHAMDPFADFIARIGALQSKMEGSYH